MVIPSTDLEGQTSDPIEVPAATGTSRVPGGELGGLRRRLAILAARHADKHLVTLVNGHRRRERGGFERRFLGGILAVYFAIVLNAPIFTHRHDFVLSHAHFDLHSRRS